MSFRGDYINIFLELSNCHCFSNILLGLPLFVRKRGFCLPTCVCVCVCVCVHRCIEKERNRQTEREREGTQFDAMTTELKLYSALPYGT